MNRSYRFHSRWKAVSKRNESETRYSIEIDHVRYVSTSKSGCVITIS